MLVARTVPLVPLGTAFHMFTMVVPDGSVMVTVHPVIAAEPAVTRTPATKPPDQAFATVKVAVHVRVPDEVVVVVVVVGGRDVVVVVVGGRLVVVVVVVGG